MKPRALTWVCHVCGDTRPDEKISVYSRVRYHGSVPIQENVRYCNDRSACIEGAKTTTFLGRRD